LYSSDDLYVLRTIFNCKPFSGFRDNLRQKDVRISTLMLIVQNLLKNGFTFGTGSGTRFTLPNKRTKNCNNPPYLPRFCVWRREIWLCLGSSLLQPQYTKLTCSLSPRLLILVMAVLIGFLDLFLICRTIPLIRTPPLLHPEESRTLFCLRRLDRGLFLAVFHRKPW
jgi:hypothetical protein